MSKLRVSLSEKGDEIKGVVELPRDDPGFVLECLLMVIRQFAKNSEVSVYEVLNDLNALDQGKVK